MSNGVFKVLAIWSIAVLGMAVGVSAQTRTIKTFNYTGNDQSHDVSASPQKRALIEIYSVGGGGGGQGGHTKQSGVGESGGSGSGGSGGGAGAGYYRFVAENDVTFTVKIGNGGGSGAGRYTGYFTNGWNWGYAGGNGGHTNITWFYNDAANRTTAYGGTGGGQSGGVSGGGTSGYDYDGNFVKQWYGSAGTKGADGKEKGDTEEIGGDAGNVPAKIYYNNLPHSNIGDGKSSLDYKFGGGTGGYDGHREPQGYGGGGAGGHSSDRAGQTGGHGMATFVITYLYTVMFDALNGDGNSNTIYSNVLDGTPTSNLKPTNNPTRNGYYFERWTSVKHSRDIKDAWDFSTKMVTENTTIYALFLPTTYSISYHLDGGTNHPSNPASYHIETDNITLQTPTRTHYTFDGWWNAQTGGTRVTTINKGSMGNKTFYARWTPIVRTVTFNTQGGSSVPSVNVNSGGKISKPTPDPTKAGDVFAYWSTSTDPRNGYQWNFPSDVVTSNITLYAIWENADNMIRLPLVERIYDGNPKKLGYIEFKPQGSPYFVRFDEDAHFTAEYENNTNSGMASVTITLKDAAYQSVGAVTKQFSIEKRNISVRWSNTRLTWNDEEQAPTPTPVLNADKAFAVEVEEITWRKDVGINFVARAVCADTNIIISEGKEEYYDIVKRKVTVEWKDKGPFVYDRKEQGPIATAQIDFGGGRVKQIQLDVPNRKIAAGEYTAEKNSAARAVVVDGEISRSVDLENSTCDFVIEKKPLKVRLENTVNDTVKIENGERFASVKEIEDYLNGLLEYEGFAVGNDGSRDDESVFGSNPPKVSIREIPKEDNAPRFARAESLMDLIRLYEVMIETENAKADNYNTPQAQEGVILSISEFRGATSIGNNVEKSDSRYGIRIKGDNIVSQKAEISVVVPIPNSDKTEIAREIKVVIYDNTGNAVFSGEERSGSGAKVTWDLRNKTGRNVANGAYLVIVEAKGINGKIYWYSAKIGVKR